MTDPVTQPDDEFTPLGEKPVKLKFLHPEGHEIDVEMPACEAARHIHRHITSLDRIKKAMSPQ